MNCLVFAAKTRVACGVVMLEQGGKDASETIVFFC
jgi:hypothetical protein